MFQGFVKPCPWSMTSGPMDSPSNMGVAPYLAVGSYTPNEGASVTNDGVQYGSSTRWRSIDSVKATFNSLLSHVPMKEWAVILPIFRYYNIVKKLKLQFRFHCSNRSFPSQIKLSLEPPLKNKLKIKVWDGFQGFYSPIFRGHSSINYGNPWYLVNLSSKEFFNGFPMWF